MPTTFENINVICVYGNIETEDIVSTRAKSFVSFEDMLENRKKEMAKIIDKLRAMDIGMLFLEGSIDKESNDLLFNKEIVVISKVDIAILNK